MLNCGVSSFIEKCILFFVWYVPHTYIPLSYYKSPDYGSGELPLQQQKLNDNNAAQISSWMSRDIGLTITITTHRIILIDEHEKIGGSIPLPLVQTAQKAGGPSFSSPMGSYKIELSTHAWGDLTIVFRGGEDSSYRESIKHRDDTLDAIHMALKRKAWNDRERQIMKEQLRPSRAIAAKKVGVDAIMTQNALRREYLLLYTN